MVAINLDPSIVEKVLNFDPIQAAEDKLGEGEASVGLALNLTMAHNKAKEEMLRQMDDTHFSMKWEEFISLLTSHRFEVVLNEKFQYCLTGEEPRQEEMSVLFHPDGLLVVADSYRGSLNSGQCHFNWKPDADGAQWPVRASGGYNPPLGMDRFTCDRKELILCGHLDVREAMFFSIATLRREGTLLKRWTTGQDCVYLMSFKDWDATEDLSPQEKQQAIEQLLLAREAKLPKHVIDCIGKVSP